MPNRLPSGSISSVHSPTSELPELSASALPPPSSMARLGNELAGVTNIRADPFARVAGLEPAELRCVPDLHPCVLRGVPRAQPCLVFGGRMRRCRAVGSVPLREHSVLIAVPGVD